MYKGVIAGMGDVHIGIDELNLLLEYWLQSSRCFPYMDKNV